MFNKLNAEHFAQIDKLLDSAILMVDAINSAEIDHKLIQDNNAKGLDKFRALVQNFKDPYISSFAAIGEGITNILNLQVKNIFEKFNEDNPRTDEIDEYFKSYAACKKIILTWDDKILKAGTAFNWEISNVTSLFYAIEETYHEKLKNLLDGNNIFGEPLIERSCQVCQVSIKTSTQAPYLCRKCTQKHWHQGN